MLLATYYCGCSEHWKPAKTTLEAGIDGLCLDGLSVDSRVVASKLHMTYRDVDPLVAPIYQASTYKIKSVQHYLDILDEVSAKVT